MARKKEDVETKSDEKSVKPKIRYFSTFMAFGFDYPAVDKDGVVKIKRNAQGTPIYDSNGNEIPIHLHAKFTNLRDRVSEGFLSFFDFDPNDETAQNVAKGEALEKLRLDTTVNVSDEDEHDKKTNPEMFTEKKKRKALEEENAKLKADMEALNTPEGLQKKLDELTQ